MHDPVRVPHSEPTHGELVEGLERVREAPRDAGILELIVGRHAVDQRTQLQCAELGVETGPAGGGGGAVKGGVVAARWSRGSRPNLKSQVTVMNARAADLVSGGHRSRWALAGDQ